MRFSVAAVTGGTIVGIIVEVTSKMLLGADAITIGGTLVAATITASIITAYYDCEKK